MASRRHWYIPLLQVRIVFASRESKNFSSYPLNTATNVCKMAVHDILEHHFSIRMHLIFKVKCAHYVFFVFYGFAQSISVSHNVIHANYLYNYWIVHKNSHTTIRTVLKINLLSAPCTSIVISMNE